MNGSVNHVCNLLDADKAMGDPDLLAHSTAPYFAPPVHEKIVIEMSNKCYKILDRFFNPETRILARTPFQLFDLNK